MNAAVSLNWPLDKVAAAVGGQLVGSSNSRVEVVSIDSRSIGEGALFVAIRGDRFDGHDFVDAAMASGALASIVEADAGIEAVPRIEVRSTADALLSLAALRRSELTIPVVAITGSTGKTSTKDLIAAGIEGSWASPRSFNNEVGVPLTVLATPDTATALVLEVGSRGRGHIEWLSSAIEPDVAVVTNLGVVHLETFGSEEGLADAKYELLGLLGAEGTGVIPADEPRLHRDGDYHRVTFGAADADVTWADVALDANGKPSFTLVVGGDVIDVTLAMAGEHQAMNAAAAVSVALALNVDVDVFIAGLSQAGGSEWRMDVHTGSFTVVNDSYNANPQSVVAALRSISQMGHQRSVAVLGPMAELGPVCESEHARVGRIASDLGVDVLVSVGPDHGYSLGFDGEVVNATDLQVAADTLQAIVEPGDVVLVKASRSAGLEALATQLIERAAQ